MKVDGYICDCCDKIFKEESIFSLEIKAVNIFDKDIRYKAIPENPHKYKIHFCMVCYNEKVTDLVETYKVNRANNESEYSYYLNLHMNLFYKKLHHNSQVRK